MKNKQFLVYLKSKYKYLIILLIYLLSILGFTSLLIQAIIFPIIKDNKDYVRNLNNEEYVVELVINNQDAIGIITSLAYESYAKEMDKFVIPVYSYFEDSVNYIFIINNYSTHVTSTYLDKMSDNSLIIKQTIIDQILDGTLNKWDNGSTITFYSMDPDFKSKPSFLNQINTLYIDYYLKNADGTNTTDSNGNLIIRDNYIQMANFGSLINFIYFLVMLIPMILLIKKDLFDDIIYVKENYKPFQYLKIILIGFGIIIISLLLSNVFVNLIQYIFNYNPPSPSNQINLDRNSVGSNRILMIMTIAFIGPLVEEIVFRKAFFKLIPNSIVAIVTSSLIFGLIHVTGEISTGNILLIITVASRYIFAGFAFSIIYSKYKNNLIVTSGSHIINNTLSLFPILF